MHINKVDYGRVDYSKLWAGNLKATGFRIFYINVPCVTSKTPNN